MLRRLEFDDMNQAAAVHRKSFDQALPHLAGLHTQEEDFQFFRERVFSTCELWGYFENRELAGIVAFRDGWIDHLYVLPGSQGRGIGTALLNAARDHFAKLSLWTFRCNQSARQFYEKHGFLLIRETGGTGNEENEPDVMYSWSSAP